MVGSHGGRAPQHTGSVVALRLLVDGVGAAVVRRERRCYCFALLCIALLCIALHCFAIAQCCLANDRAALTVVIPRLTAQSDT